MDEKKQEVRYDLNSYEVLTEAIMKLVNRFPQLEEGETFAFATLGETDGLAVYPGTEGIIEAEKKSVTGRARQVCRYPFYVLSRAGGLSENRKIDAKEWLDSLGRWLEQVKEYPALTGGRRFLSFSIQTPAYLYDASEDHVETWAVAITARYENIFYK